METDFREKQQKRYRIMRMTYDITIAVLLFGMATIMLFAKQLNIQQLLEEDNTFFRYFFGGLCLLYGGFRLYRGVSREN